MSEVGIAFGSTCKPIVEQLEVEGYRISEEDALILQRMVDAINLLNLHSIIPDNEAHKARTRVLKKIIKAVENYDGV